MYFKDEVNTFYKEAYIMPEDIVFVGCHDGTDFENKVVKFLNENGFKANRVVKGHCLNSIRNFARNSKRCN